MVLDAVLKLLEKLIKLGEVREANRQRYVDRYVEPLYQVAEGVYRDYSTLLRQVRRRIETGRKTLPVIKFLEQRRLDQLPNRVRIRAILNRTGHSNMTLFEQGILGLIRGCLSEADSHQSIHPVSWRGGDHTVYDLIRRIEERFSEDLRPMRPRLLAAVDHQIEGIDKAWEAVCSGYADLRAMAVPSVSVTPSLPKRFEYPHDGD